MFILSIIILIIILITYSCQWVGWHKECRGKLEQSRSSQHLAQPSSNILNQDTYIDSGDENSFQKTLSSWWWLLGLSRVHKSQCQTGWQLRNCYQQRSSAEIVLVLTCLCVKLSWCLIISMPSFPFLNLMIQDTDYC